MTYPTGDADMGVGGNAWTDNDGNIWSDTLNAWVTPDGQYYYTGSGWALVSSYDPWGTGGGSSGGGTTTTPKATTSTLKATSGGSTGGGSIPTTSAWVDPQDKNGDGIDDSTGYANGVVKVPTSVSWTGYTYNGEYVWPNGAPAGPDPNATTGGGAPTTTSSDTALVTRADGSIVLIDRRTGQVISTVSGPKPVSTSSGGSSGGSGGNTNTSVRTGGFTDTNISEYGPERVALEQAQIQLQREIAAAKNETDLAIANMNYALNLRRLGLDERKFGVDAAETFGRLASSTDPLAFAAFLHAGGGNIMNSLGAGNDALSPAALLPAARALQAMRGLGSGGTGFPTSGGFGTRPGDSLPAGGAPPPAAPTPAPVVPPLPGQPGSEWQPSGDRTVNTNSDPLHGVYQPVGEWGQPIGGYQGYVGNTGQYEVIAGPTAGLPPPTGVPATYSPPPGTEAFGGPAGPAGPSTTSVNAPYVPPPGTDAYGMPYKATVPMYARGTMRGLTRYATGTWSDPQIQQIAQFQQASPGSVTQPSQETNPAVLAAISTQKAYLNSPQYQAAFGEKMGPISPLDYAKWKASYYDFLSSTGRPMANRYAPAPPVQPVIYSEGDWAQIQRNPALKARYEANLAQQGGSVAQPAPQAFANAAPQAAFQRPPVAAPPNLGFVNDPMMVTGDAPLGSRPDAGGTRPEVIVNPTQAPIGVVDTDTARRQGYFSGGQIGGRNMTGLNALIPRLAEGTGAPRNWWDTATRTYSKPQSGVVFHDFGDGSYALKPATTNSTIPYGNDVVAQPAPTPAPTPVAQPTTSGTRAGGDWSTTLPDTSVSNPALNTPPVTTTGGTTGNTAGGTTTGVGGIGANVPGSGYGVTPLTPGQLGVGAGDIPTMEEVLGLRQGTQVPNLNYYDIAFNDQLPTLQQLYFSGLQGKYGIPQQDSLAEWQKYRMRGLSGGNMALGV